MVEKLKKYAPAFFAGMAFYFVVSTIVNVLL